MGCQVCGCEEAVSYRVAGRCWMQWHPGVSTHEAFDVYMLSVQVAFKEDTRFKGGGKGDSTGACIAVQIANMGNGTYEVRRQWRNRDRCMVLSLRGLLWLMPVGAGRSITRRRAGLTKCAPSCMPSASLVMNWVPRCCECDDVSISSSPERMHVRMHVKSQRPLLGVRNLRWGPIGESCPSAAPRGISLRPSLVEHFTDVQLLDRQGHTSGSWGSVWWGCCGRRGRWRVRGS